MANLVVNRLKNHLHPLGGRIIFWNFVLFLLVKLIIPNSAFQTASLLGLTPTFDSREVVSATNEARVENHLPILKPNTKLDIAASEKLNDMAIQEYFSHVSPNGVNPWYWIKKSEYQYSVAGENLAIGFITADDTIKAWLNSPSHKANILNNQYQDIGVAVKSVEINDREGILVVQMFGKPLNPTVTIAKTPTLSPTKVTINSPEPSTVLPQTKGESVNLVQEISTDTSIKPVNKPTIVRPDNPEKIIRVSKLLNNAFSVYSTLIALMSMLAFFFFQRNKNMAFKMSLNVALVLLTILIPASQIYFEGLIF